MSNSTNWSGPIGEVNLKPAFQDRRGCKEKEASGKPWPKNHPLLNKVLENIKQGSGQSGGYGDG